VKSLFTRPVYSCGIVLILVCALEIVGRYVPRLDVLQRLEAMTYDWRLRLAARHNPTVAPNLGMVFISDESITALLDGTLDYRVGLYWPRHVYGRLVRELSAQKATAVGFDILFAETRPDHGSAQLADGTLTSSDHFFAEEMRAASNVVLAAHKGLLPAPLFRTNALSIGSISIRPDADGILRRARAYEDFYVWHPLIRQAARLRGFDLRQPKFEEDKLTFTTSGQEDFVFPLRNGAFDQLALYELLTGSQPPRTTARYLAPATPIRAWDLGITLAAQQLGLDLAAAKIQPGSILLPGTNGVSRTIPVDDNGCFYIDWALTPFHPNLTRESIESLLLQEKARRLSEPAPTSNRWEGKLVVVGSVASGNDLTDLGPTPLEKESYLASRYLNVANSVLLDRFIRPLPAGASLILAALFSAFAGWITWRLRPSYAAPATFSVALLYLFTAVLMHLQHRLWVPICVPLCSLVLSHFSLLGYRVLAEHEEQRRIRGVFSKIVSPNVVNELLKEDHLPLEGARCNVTIMFADVRGFTELTDQAHAQALRKLDAQSLDTTHIAACCESYTQQVLDTVNLYLGLIADIIKQNDGTLDKYIGDCVMAFWGAPSPQAHNAVAGVRSAIATQQAINQLNQERQAENLRREQSNPERIKNGEPALPPLHILTVGIGLNTGNSIVGLMGSRAHILNYTVFGREVNLASRLEALSQRERITIGEATYRALLQDDDELAALCVPLPPVQVKGFREAVNIYQVPWEDCLPQAAAA
jgi:class 3 adenylate cyclase/CHASE2 domain-containing sensor protein